PGCRRVVAFLICDQRFKRRAPTAVPHREKAQKDDRRNVALVVGRFDRTAERNRRPGQLLGERDDAAVLAFSCLLGFFVADLRFAVIEGLYFDVSGIGGKRLTFSATLRQAPIRSETSLSSTSRAPSYSVRFPHVVALRQNSPDLRAEAESVWQHLKND